jgi:hypothetical protein
MLYRVIVEERLARDVQVEANDANEAYEIVRGMYRNGDIVLDDSDFTGETEFIEQGKVD